MVGKSNLPSDAENRTDVMGSSLQRYRNALDQERAASMADEGGMAGVIADARDEAWAMSGAGEEKLRVRPGRQRWVVLGLIALGFAALVAGVWLRRRP